MAVRLADGITRELAALEVHARHTTGYEFEAVVMPRDEWDVLVDLHRRAKAVTSELDRTDREIHEDHS